MPKVQTGAETHIITDSPRCPICSLQANVYRRKTPSNLFEGSCERCGDVAITLSAIEEATKQDYRHLVSAWLRRRPASEPPVTLEKDSVERILKDTQEYSALEKLDLTIVQIEKLTDFPGQESKFDYERDYPLVYAKNPDEANFYLSQLADLGYIKGFGTAGGLVKPSMKAGGYQRLSEIQQASRESAFAFVAMWFDASITRYMTRQLSRQFEKPDTKLCELTESNTRIE